MESLLSAEGCHRLRRPARGVAKRHGARVRQWSARSLPSHRRSRYGDLSNPAAVPALKCQEQRAGAGSAVPVPSFASAGKRLASAAFTPSPRCIPFGMVGLRGVRRGAGSHRAGLRKVAALSAVPKQRSSPSAAVLVPSVSSEESGRVALAATEGGGRGGRHVVAVAGGLLPSAAASPALGVARSSASQPNMAVEGTLRLVASFKFCAVVLAAKLSLAAVVAARPSPK